MQGRLGHSTLALYSPHAWIADSSWTGPRSRSAARGSRAGPRADLALSGRRACHPGTAPGCEAGRRRARGTRARRGPPSDGTLSTRDLPRRAVLGSTCRLQGRAPRRRAWPGPRLLPIPGRVAGRADHPDAAVGRLGVAGRDQRRVPVRDAGAAPVRRPDRDLPAPPGRRGPARWHGEGRSAAPRRRSASSRTPRHAEAVEPAAGRRRRPSPRDAEPPLDESSGNAACKNSQPSQGSRRPLGPVPVLATYFSVRRGRDPFFKFFMKTIFPRQVKEYEEKFGIRFVGWFNVAHGWDFDNVIMFDLPDYATLDKLEADEATRALGHRAGEWIFERHHSMFLRERLGPDLEYHG